MLKKLRKKHKLDLRINVSEEADSKGPLQVISSQILAKKLLIEQLSINFYKRS
jgi:hypothetical protein